MASIHCIEYWKRAVDGKVEITFFFSEFVSPRVSSIRELGNGGFEKEK